MLSIKSGLRETDSSRDARSAAVRAFSKPTKQRFTQAILRSFNDVEVHSPAGLYLGKRLVYNVDLTRLCKVIERTVLGLHLEEFKTRLPEGHQCKAYALEGFTEASLAATGNIKTLWKYATSGQRRDLGVNVFTYWVHEMQDTQGASLWAFVVYGSVGFLAITAPANGLLD
ncbi:MAG: hypothetical protein P4L10_07755 [Acidobacteriaceae bacterium]|nr:hypothetical protein [Acidobacteriaceae bacterium]